MKLSELTQVALLGTERQGLPMTAGGGSLQGLLAQIDLNRREEGLLSAAALSALHEDCGRLPSRDEAPMAEPCAAEEWPRMSERAGSVLLRLLGEASSELLPEFLGLAAQMGRVAFPEALPGLLQLGVRKSEWREAIVPVLGRRGGWLAGQNLEWSWASGTAEGDETIWQIGESAPRLLFLQQLRRKNPGRASELLAGTWKEETPEDRGRFIATLEIGLSELDEAFLEAALDDKRKEVRRVASALLVRLPASGLAKRVTERVRLLLKFVPAESGGLFKLKKSKPATIEVTLPNECDKSMQRDGIEPKAQEGFGEKSWWLIQMLELTPLEFWTTEWNVSAAEIVTASLGGEWEKELVEGWAWATIRQKNAEWAEALIAIAWSAKSWGRIERLLPALAAKQRELHLSALLEGESAQTTELHGALFAHCGHEWSPEFSRTILSWLKKTTARQSSDWALRNRLGDFAPRLAFTTLQEAAQGWPTDSDGWVFWAAGVDEFLALVQFRSDLHTAFSEPKNDQLHEPAPTTR